MTRGETVGTWFPSGFHGHFRSKSRLDFINEYRHLAKPAPPQTFVRRTKTRSTDHQFSHHDNRNSFMNDALYFEQGLGRRRIPNKSTAFQPNLLAWAMNKVPVRGQEVHNSSMYQIDFRHTKKEPIQQHIVTRPKTSFDDHMPMTTTYRYTHGKDNPNKSMLDVKSNRALSGSVENRRQRAFSAGPSTGNRESVASCMSWSVVPNHTKTRSIVPASTTPKLTVEGHLPSPPSGPKTCPPTTIALLQPTPPVQSNPERIMAE